MTGGRAEDRQTGWPDGTAIREEGIATLALAMTGGRAEDRQTGWPDGTAIRYPMKDDALKKPGCSEVQLLAASLGVWFWAGKAQAHG